MPTPRCTQAILRSTLNNLYDPRALRASPLIQALGLSDEGDAPARLRRLLTQAIQSLRPGDDVPSQAPAQRVYEVLHYRYVQQCSQDEVAEQLGLGVRQLKREQRKALEVLAHRLRDVYGLEVGPDEDPEAVSADEGEAPAPAMELSWLDGSSPGEPVDLQGVLPAVYELVQPLAARYRVQLQVGDLQGVPALAVDAVALRQALLSLLAVAIRRTAGGKLTLSVRRLRWQVAIRIAGAKGQGVAEPAPEDAANLANARQLAGVCGGSLTLSSGEGLSAELTLPAAEQLPVLAIDDNADTLRLLQRYASCTRYRVLGAQNADQAFALAREVSPWAIVLDIMMPRVDGWELLKRLAQHPLTQGVPVIACTILAQEELALSLGVKGFLQKPISRRDFLAALDRLDS